MIAFINEHREVCRVEPICRAMDKALPCPMDRVNRQFSAAMPNQLWVSDFTYVSTWQGFDYVAYVIDTFANKIVGWRASRSQQTQFVLDFLE